MTTKEQREAWHMSKTVSLGTAFGLILNVAVMIYMFGQQSAEFTAAITSNTNATNKNETRIVETQRNAEVIRDSLRAEINNIRRETSAQAVAIGRIEVGITNIQKTLEAK